MNRRSLFGRFAAPIVKRTADRQEHYRVHVEPLEDRKLLTATYYVDDNWVRVAGSGTITSGMLVTSSSDAVNNTITAQYGIDAFGTVANATSPNGVNIHYLSIANGDAINARYIHDAINVGTVVPGDLISVLEGTYTESDIVIDKQVSLFGSGQSGTTNTLIVPEVVSAKTDIANFGTGTHAGIIIYSPSVTVANLHLNGNGNGALGTSLHYNQAITTLYDTQGGGSYASIRNGSLPVKHLSGTGDATVAYTDLAIDAAIATNITSAAVPFVAGDVGKHLSVSGGTGFTPGLYRINSVTGVIATLDAPVGALSSVGGQAIKTDTTTHPRLQIQDVTVENVFYHGITLAGAPGTIARWTSADGISTSVARATVTNVGDAGNQDLTRIGILGLNLRDSAAPPGDGTGGNMDTNTVTSAGVGISMATFGLTSYNDDTNARNRGLLIGNKVIGNITAGFFLQNMDGNDYFVNNFANFSGGNTATGILLDHSSFLAMNSQVNGAKIGARLQNTTGQGSTPAPIFAVNSKLTGPGTAVAGSIGILMDNDATGQITPILLTNFNEITGYATGVKALQSFSSSTTTILAVDRTNVHGNAIGFNVGDGVTVLGTMTTPDPVFDPGTVIAPGFPQNNKYADSITSQVNYPVPGTETADYTPPPPAVTGKVTAQGTADTISTGSLTLGATSTYIPKILGNPGGTLPLVNFNSAYTFTNINVSQDGLDPWKYNGGVTFKPSGLALLLSPSFVSQPGTGTINIGTQPGAELGAVYKADEPLVNAQGYTALYIVAKKHADNVADQFQFGISDQDGTMDLHFVPFNSISSTTFTTLTINLLSSIVGLNDGDKVMNMSAITGWIIGGDIGLSNFNAGDAFGIEVDEIGFSKPLGNDQLNVTGSVDLGSAKLTPFTPSGFVPTINQPFTIVNNDSSDTISGTFGGIAEGGTVNGGAIKYQVSYVGGVLANDVVIKRVADTGTPVVDLNGGVAGTGFSSTWTNAGAISITDASNATVVDPDVVDTIAQMTATITTFHTGDVLSAVLPTSLGISASYNGTGTLTLTGGASQAFYQQALRLIQYNNTAGGPGVGTVSVNIAADDGMVGSGFGINAVATITNSLFVPSGSIPAGGRKLFYNNSAFDGNSALINASDDGAIATDKTPYISGSGLAAYTAVSNYNKGINGIMVDLAGGGSHGSIGIADFAFKVSSVLGDNTPSGWAAGPVPATISTRIGAGISGSDRVEIIWATNAIKNQWLEVQVLATANTGLPASDVFFWANRLGDTGAPSATDFSTTVAGDGGTVLAGLGAGTGITNIRDMDKTNSVTVAGDRGVVLANLSTLNRLNLTAGAFAPVGAGPSASPAAASADSGVASGLTASTAVSGPAARIPGWIVDRLRKLDLNSGPIADYFQRLHDEGTPRAKAILAKADRIADALGLDDEFLDSLLDA